MITGAQPDSPAWALERGLWGLAGEAGPFGSQFRVMMKTGEDSLISPPAPKPTHPVPSLALKLTLPPSLSPQTMRGGSVQAPSERSRDPPFCCLQAAPSQPSCNLPRQTTKPSPCLAGRKCWLQGRVLSRPCDAEDGHYPESSRAVTSSLC